jgi:RimJ/RimL family protein N-acetyltransferase
LLGFFVARNPYSKEALQMNIDLQLFEGEHIRLASIDHEKDAEVESKWTHDADYLRQLGVDVARPLSPAQLKKQYEAIEEEIEKSKSQFYFTIRMRSDDRMIGFAMLYRIEWSNGVGMIQLGLGDEIHRKKGYGTEALKMLLRYAFAELNLHRLAAEIPEYNTGALRLFERHGFAQEVCRRQALNRNGQRWDLLLMGILRTEWEQS